MSNYDNTNSGILGRNERKVEDKHPDFKGSINIEGREYWLDGWIKERKDGSGRFFSLRAKAKDGAGAGVSKPATAPAAPIDDDIPF